MPIVDAKHVHFPDRAALRAWLLKHHASHPAIWLVYDKSIPGKPRAPHALSYDALVEEALCFGWIDSVPGKVDANRTKVYLSPRKPKSGWSAVNKRRIEKLTAAGLIHPSGQAKIDAAKHSGAWTLLDTAESLTIPPDFARALKAKPKAKTHYNAFPPGARKQILRWIISAKRPETRAARIAQAVALAAENIRASDPKARQSISAGRPQRRR